MAIQGSNVNLKQEKITKIFWKYAIPSLIGILAQNTAGFIDSIFIGRFVGANGLSAITLIMPFIMFYSGTGTMLAIGGSTLAGIYKGKGDKAKSNNYFMVTISLLAIVAVIASILLFFSSGIFTALLNVKGEVASFVQSYTRILAVFALPFMMSFAFLFFIKLDGNPTIAVATSVVGTILNVILNFVFIVIFKWKIVGAALATGLSQLIPFLLFTYFIFYKSSWYLAKPNYKAKEIFNIVFNGSSELLSMASISIAGFIYNVLIIKHVGINGVAAYTVAMQTAAIAIDVFYGFSESTHSAVSVNIGAEQLQRVKKLRNITLKANMIVGLLFCCLSLVFGKYIVKIFITDKSVIALAITILNFNAYAFALKGVNIALSTYYTAVNSPLLSCIIALSRTLIAFVIGLYILPLIFKTNGIWLATIFAEVVTVIVAFIFLKKYPFGSMKDIKKQVA